MPRHRMTICDITNNLQNHFNSPFLCTGLAHLVSDKDRQVRHKMLWYDVLWHHHLSLNNLLNYLSALLTSHAMDLSEHARHSCFLLVMTSWVKPGAHMSSGPSSLRSNCAYPQIQIIKTMTIHDKPCKYGTVLQRPYRTNCPLPLAPPWSFHLRDCAR